MKNQQKIKIQFFFIQTLLWLAQSQESWKIISNQFIGSNWDSSNWNIYHKWGEREDLTYNCGNTQLFGGFNLFASNTSISTKYTIPPHYSLRVSLDLWNWDCELMSMILDQEIYRRIFCLNEGEQICGVNAADFFELNVLVNITITNHNSQSLVIIMAAFLSGELNNESWGFQDLKVEILECPVGCEFCMDQTSSCKYWTNVASYWNSQISSEGWLINGVQPLTSSLCADISIAGGIDVLQVGKRIDKLIENLPPHFKIQIMFKLWTIGEFQSKVFQFVIDDKPVYSIPITSLDFIINFCSNQKVKITNIDVNLLHTSTSIKLSMNLGNIINELAYWGVTTFELFVAQCSIGCKECTGELGRQCTICLDGWFMIDVGGSFPLECSQVRLNHFSNKQVDLVNFMNSFKISSDEIGLNISDIGQQTLIIDKLISYITFQVQVKCQEQLIVKSYFRYCDQCSEQQFDFSDQCLNQNNVLIYHATFLQVAEYKKEIIITISQSKLEVVQVSKNDEASREFVLLQIEK